MTHYKARERDVINVHRFWTVFLGTRIHAVSIGTVQHADAWLARQAAWARFPNHPRHRVFVDETFG